MENLKFKCPIKFDVSQAGINLLKSKYKDLTITDRQSYQEVVKGIREVRSLRVAVEKRRKELKKDVLAYGRLIDSTARGIVKQLLPIEARLKDLKKEEDNRKLQEKLEKERKERERVETIKAKLQELAMPDSLCLTQESADQIHERILALSQYGIQEEIFQEFTENAIFLRSETISKLQELEGLKRKQEQEERERQLREKALEEERKRLAEEARKAEEARLALEEQARKAEEERLVKEKELEAKARALEEKERLLAEKETEKQAEKVPPVIEVKPEPIKEKETAAENIVQQDIERLRQFIKQTQKAVSDTFENLKDENLRHWFDFNSSRILVLLNDLSKELSSASDCEINR